MLLFWAVAGVLAAVAAGLILMRAAAAAARAAAPDPAPALYRRQLAEIDDLAERGLMGEAERDSARAEAGRRLLAAADAPAEPWTADVTARRIAVIAAAAAPALALGLYLKVGAAGMPDQPYARRLAAWTQSDLRTLDAPEIAAVLRQATARRPNEAEGFRLLALAEDASGNPIAAVRALRRAVQLSPDDPDLWRLLGQYEVGAGGGKVGDAARSAFERLLALQPGDVTARFFLAQAKADAGQEAEADAAFKALLADMRPDDKRRGAVEEAIGRIENKPSLGGDPQQMAMIRGMVSGLAARLKAQPDDPAGWVRLVRAYAVLGETKARDDAYADARARFAAKPDVLEQLDEAARAEPMR